MRAPSVLVLSCEHAGNRVPARHARLLRGRRRLLESHRGWDPGALGVARAIARRLEVPLLAHTTTRLLADANRSLMHRRLFSEVTRALPPPERTAILARHWAPHRRAVEAAVRQALAQGARVLHLSVHSFTPVFDGERRRVDVGLLFDPHHPGERTLCRRWQAILRELDPALRVRRNAPYRGVADGITTTLRRALGTPRYLGVELELSQALVAPGAPAARRVRALVAESLAQLLGRGARVSRRSSSAGRARARSRA